jgi:hypothetical protein
VWQYEPEAVCLPSWRQYRADFYLPEIATFLEVKGPHDNGIDKTRELAETVKCRNGSFCQNRCDEPVCGEHQLVVIGRAPVAGKTVWESADGRELSLQECSDCGAYWWVDECLSYGCRKHRRYEGGDSDRGGVTYDSALNGTGLYSDYLPFVRVPYRFAV